MRAPNVFVTMDSVPQDLLFKPTCCVIGPPSSGKSDICNRISQSTGAVHLRIKEIIDDLIKMDCILGNEVRMNLDNGRELSEEQTVQLLQKRIQLQDCLLRGFVLEDFPRTRKEAMLFNKFCIPNFVFYLDCPLETAYERTEALKDSEFLCDRQVFSKHLMRHVQEAPGVLSFYQLNYDNVRYIDSV